MFGSALGAALWHNLGWFDRQAQAQGFSKLEIVAVGTDRLPQRNSATNLAILA